MRRISLSLSLFSAVMSINRKSMRFRRFSKWPDAQSEVNCLSVEIIKGGKCETTREEKREAKGKFKWQKTSRVLSVERLFSSRPHLSGWSRHFVFVEKRKTKRCGESLLLMIFCRFILSTGNECSLSMKIESVRKTKFFLTILTPRWISHFRPFWNGWNPLFWLAEGIWSTRPPWQSVSTVTFCPHSVFLHQKFIIHHSVTRSPFPFPYRNWLFRILDFHGNLIFMCVFRTSNQKRRLTPCKFLMGIWMKVIIFLSFYLSEVDNRKWSFLITAWGSAGNQHVNGYCPCNELSFPVSSHDFCPAKRKPLV